MNYTYTVTGLERKDFDGFPDTVVSVHWHMTGTDVEGYAGKFIGFTKLNEFEASSDFIEFEEITEDNVVEWIKPIIESDQDYLNYIYQRIDKSIEKQRWKNFDNPEYNTLPWKEPDE